MLNASEGVSKHIVECFQKLYVFTKSGELVYTTVFQNVNTIICSFCFSAPSVKCHYSDTGSSVRIRPLIVCIHRWILPVALIVRGVSP